MINPATGKEDPNYKQELSASIKPVSTNIGGTAPVSTVQKDSLNTSQVQAPTGGPKVNLDVMNKYREKLGAGPALEHTTTPQAPDSTISNVSGGFSNLKPVTPVGTPPVGTGITPTPPVATPQAETIDTTKLSPEELAYYNAQKTRIDAIGAKKGMEAAIKDMQAELKLDKEKKFATDVEEAMQFAKNQAERQMEISRIQNERDIKDASDKLAKQVENAQRFKGAVGFPQTQAALKAQQGNIDRTRQVIGEMQTINKLVNEGNAERLAKQMNELQDQLDLNVSKAVQETMTNLQTLITSGKLDSVEAIVKAKTDLMDGLNSKYNDFLNNTFEASQLMLQQAETQLKNYHESQKYNDDFTKQMGDGFMYNVNGQKMTDARGNPLRAISTAGKPLSTTPITLNDGSLAMIYQNPDGTVRTEKLEGTKPVELTPQALVKYSDLVSRGAISVDDLRQLGFSREDINSIVSQVTPETTTKLKNVTIEDAEGNKIPASYNETTGEYTVGGQVYSGEQITGSGGTITGGTDLRIVANKYPNEASLKNNNPAGITFNNNFAATLTNAGIQFTKGTARPSAEGGNYFSFPNIEEGFKAYDLLWNSPSYTNITVGKALQRWGTGSLTGVDTTKKVGDLTQSEKEQLQIAQLRKESPGMYKELVANGMIGSEGFNIPDVPQQVEGEVNEKELKAQVKGLTIGLGGTEGERKSIQDEIVKKAISEGISVQEAKKKLGYKTGDDIEFAKTRKEDIQSIKKDTRDKLSNANTTLTLLNEPQTAIGDVASVVGFLKTIDPASVARESEVESVENARGIIDSLSNTFQKAKEGTKLTDVQRTQLKSAIQTIVDAGNDKFNSFINDTVQEFNDRGLDPSIYINKSYLEKAKASSVKNVQQPVNTGRWQQSQGTSGAGTTVPTQGRWQQSNQK